MLFVTFMLGIACGEPVGLPEGKCNPPSIQYASSIDKAGAATDLAACQLAIGNMYKELEQRGAVFDSLLYCDQRQVGAQR